MRAIQRETLAIPHKVEFAISESGDGAPPAATQRNLLRRLKGWYALEFEPKINPADENPPTKFCLTIDNKRFNELYRLFENGLKFGIESPELYELANRWVRPFSYSDQKPFEAWEIMRGIVKLPKIAKAKNSATNEPTFKLPQGTKWQNLEIKFESPFDVAISLNGKKLESSTHEKMGFFRSRTGDRVPDKQWALLRLLAAIYVLAKQSGIERVPATIADLTKALGTEGSVMTAKKKLSQRLQFIFGIQDDPFDDYEHWGYYKTKFSLVPESDLRRANPFEFGRKYDDEKLYGDIENEEDSNLTGQ